MTLHDDNDDGNLTMPIITTNDDNDDDDDDDDEYDDDDDDDDDDDETFPEGHKKTQRQVPRRHKQAAQSLVLSPLSYSFSLSLSP